jgi:hypothetical protein
LLRETNRLEEAEPLYRRVVVILCQFEAATGYPHPNLETALANYHDLLAALGLDETTINQKLQEALEPTASRGP